MYARVAVLHSNNTIADCEPSTSDQVIKSQHVRCEFQWNVIKFQLKVPRLPTKKNLRREKKTHRASFISFIAKFRVILFLPVVCCGLKWIRFPYFGMKIFRKSFSWHFSIQLLFFSFPSSFASICNKVSVWKLFCLGVRSNSKNHPKASNTKDGNKYAIFGVSFSLSCHIWWVKKWPEEQMEWNDQ